MKIIPALIVMIAVSTSLASADTVNFDDLKTGAPPPGWTATKTKAMPNGKSWPMTPPPANRMS